MDDSLIALSCKNHHNLLIGGLWNFFQTKKAVDYELNLGGHSWSVHRLILEVFLSPDDAEEDANNVSSDSFRNVGADLGILMLEFLYKGNITVRQEQMVDLLQLAKGVKFKLLVDAIESVNMSHPEDDTAEAPIRPLICRRPRAIAEKLTTRRLDRGRKRSLPEQEGSGTCTTVGPESEDADRCVKPKMRKPRKSTPRRSARHDAAPTANPEDIASAGDETEVPDGVADTSRRKSTPRRSAKEQPGAASDSIDEDEVKSQTRTRLFSCPKCPYKTHIKYRLRMHLARHDAATSLFRCNFCSNAFLSAGARDRHKARIHSGPPASLRCSHCQVEVANRNSLLSHLKVRHGVTEDGQPVEKRFGCEHCQESFVYKSALDNHVATKHTGQRAFPCSECSYSAFRRPDLRKHVKFMHVKQRPFVCEVCGFAAVTWSNMVKHHRVHSRDKPYVCRVCNKAYAYKESLKEHAVRHAEGYSEESARSHICEVCGKGFLTRKHLMGHLKGVHHAPSAAASTKVAPPPPQQQHHNLTLDQLPATVF